MKKVEAKGDMENPWEWIERAEYTGKSAYLSSKIHTWEYVVCFNRKFKNSNLAPISFGALLCGLLIFY